MPPPFDPMIFFTELVFTTLAVVFCFLIFFRTKESYELTKYTGIKYFRDAFLFFGLSYVVRFLLALIMLSKFAFDIFIPRELFMPLFILPVGYFSTMGIFYLIFSSVWKGFNNKYLLVFGHMVAILLSVISFVTHSHIILLLLQCILLVIAVIARFVIHSEKKGISQIKILYLLVAGLWLINLLVLDRKRPMHGFEFVFQILSLIVFVVIYHKVSKWAR